jgi:hypothetical protein
MKVLSLAALALGASLGLATASHASIVLTFDGLQQEEPILNYYNGGFGGDGSGPGPNYGITFSSNSLALNSGNFGNNPSPPGIAFFLSGGGDLMDVAGGFNTGFSFYYAAYTAGSVSVWSGLDGTGTELANLALPVTPNAAYDWIPIGVSFAGTALSVNFGGAANEIGFDNVTLGASTPGGVPEAPTWAMMMLGFAGLGFAGYRASRKSVAIAA